MPEFLLNKPAISVKCGNIIPHMKSQRDGYLQKEENMKKEMRYARLFTGLCIILAVMGLSIGTAGAATVTQALVNGTCFDPANS